jgi:DNA-directed RNA polymerases I, II, and III subunit RPABC2
LVLKHLSKQKKNKRRILKGDTKVKTKLQAKPKKIASTKSSKKRLKSHQTSSSVHMLEKRQEFDEKIRKPGRPPNEVVAYNELEFELRELIPKGNEVLIGPSTLTRFERARITGARSLQLSLGAPFMISVPKDARDSISLATAELDLKALPISIRRILPNGLYQDIPIDWMK